MADSRGRLLLLAMLVIATVPRHAAGARACEESGYCSTGISKHWVGDIKQSAQLRAMLEAVTYRKELVLSIFQESDGDQLWVDQALQLHWELEDMGYAHHLFITDGNSSCAKLNLYGVVSCVWDSSELPQYILAGETFLWHNRWKMIARASRIGYNVMSIDTDFMWFRDPYVHLKAEPFNKIQMLGVPEGGSVFNNNGGFMYVQNARPDGPVSWVFKQVVMSSLRRGEDNYKFMSQWTGRVGENCLSFDQSIIYDALLAAALGRPIFISALGACKQKARFKTRAGNEITSDQATRNAEALISQHLRSEYSTVRPNKDWLRKLRIQHVPETDSKMYSSNITIPNLAWGYAEELGGRFAPLEMGNLSLAFTQQLKEDCPDCPWWPERRPLPPGEDPLISLLGPKFDTPQITRDNLWVYFDKDVPQERFAQVPSWLACSLGHVRRGWVLGKNAPVQGPMVLGHVHAWHMQTARAQKAMIRKVFGRYNWTLGTYVAETTARLANPYGMRRAVHRVLALSPNVDLARTRNWEEFSSIIVGMAQVAFLTNRVLLLPNIPCQTAWLHDPDSLNDEQFSRKLCVAPTFYRHEYRFPLPVSVIVDERGELVGGWARRLRAIYQGTAMQQPVIPPMLLRPDITDEDQEAGSLLRSGGPRRVLADSDDGQVPAGWWEKQRYVIALPQLWDPSCTKELRAIIYAELFHWLKNSDQGRKAELKTSKTNTVFSPSPTAHNLKLRPAPPPGGDSAAVPAGSVVPTSKEPGWSLYDVQAALPAAQVVAQMQLFDSQPLVYMDHPVMVVHSTTDLAKEKEMYSKDESTPQAPGGWSVHQRGASDGGLGTTTPDEALTAINQYIRKSKCRATWTEVEVYDGKTVHLGHGYPSVLVDGLIQPAGPATQR